MVIMLLDHTREYVHAEATRFSPTDLTQTNVLLFLTRWITHFCAPTFVFLAGTSVYLQQMRGKSRAELSKFLIMRGLWLIVLEFTLVRLTMLFNVDYSFLGLGSNMGDRSITDYSRRIDILVHSCHGNFGDRNDRTSRLVGRNQRAASDGNGCDASA
jgi:hypothetical protein